MLQKVKLYIDADEMMSTNNNQTHSMADNLMAFVLHLNNTQ